MGVNRGLWYKIVEGLSEILNKVKFLWGNVDLVGSDFKKHN